MSGNGELLDRVLDILNTGSIPPKVSNQIIMAGLHHQFQRSKKNSEGVADLDKRVGELEREDKDRKEAKKSVKDTFINPVVGSIIGAIITVVVVKLGFL